MATPRDRDLLIRTVIGEAAGEPPAGQAAVAHVVLNRVKSGKYGGRSIPSVLFAKNQFEPWQTRRAELAAISPDSPEYRTAARVVDGVLAGQVPDPTKGAMHFLNQKIVRERRGGGLPSWAASMEGTAQDIGQHTFYGGQRVAQNDRPVFDRERFEARKAQMRAGAQPTPTPTPAPAPQGNTGEGRPVFDPERYAKMKEKMRPTRLGGERTAPVEAPEAPDAPPVDRRSYPRRAYDAVRDVVVGDAEYDVPELGQEILNLPVDIRPRAVEMSRGLLLADNEKAMANIVKKHFPEAEVTTDKNDNIYVKMPGVDGLFALDKAGISPRDVDEFVKMGATALAAVGGAKLGEMLGPLFKYLGAGAGAGLESVAEQAASEWAGGGQGFDEARVIFSALFGVGGEAASTALQYLGPKLWRELVGAKASAANPQEYIVQLREMGVDPVEAERRIRDALSRAGVEDIDESALRRIADAQALPSPIELTAGQATRNPAKMRQEEIARETTGAYGPDIQRAAIEKYREQQRQLLENSGALMPGAAGDVAQAGRDVQQALVRKRAQAEAGVDAAYDAAREAPGQAVIGAAGLQGFVDQMRSELTAKFIPSAVPQAKEVLEELAELLKPMVGPGGAKITPKGVDIRRLENWRQKVSRAAFKAESSEAEALRDLVKAYDKSSLGQLKRAIISGDAETIQLWRDAVASRKRFGRVWENEDIIQTISQTARKGRYGELDVDAGDVIAEILGRSTLGTKKGTAREVARLKAFFRDDPEQFGKIKAEAIVKLLGLDPRQTEGVEKFGTQVVNNLRNALKNHPEVIGELFEPTEIAAIRRFAKTVENINTFPTFSAGNPSGSGFTAIEGTEQFRRALTWLGRQMGIAGEATAGFLVRRVDQVANARRDDAMRRQLAGAFGPRREFVTGAGAAVGGAYGDYAGQDGYNQ